MNALIPALHYGLANFLDHIEGNFLEGIGNGNSQLFQVLGPGSVNFVFDNSPYKKVHGGEVWGSGRPEDGTSSTDPTLGEMLIQPGSGQISKMGRRAVMLVPQLRNIRPISKYRPQIIFKQVQVRLGCDSVREEERANKASGANPNPHTQARAIQFSFDCDPWVLSRPIDAIVTIYMAVKFEYCLIGPQNSVRNSRILLDQKSHIFAIFQSSVWVVIQKSLKCC